MSCQKQTARVAAQQRAIDAFKQQRASIEALGERLTALERQVQTANADQLRSLARK